MLSHLFFKNLDRLYYSGAHSGRFFFHAMASLVEMECKLTNEPTRVGLEVVHTLRRTSGQKRRMTASKIVSAKRFLQSDVLPHDVTNDFSV